MERLLAGLGPAEHGFAHLDLGRPVTGSGRLAGWRLSIKDLTDVAGMPTTMGSARRTYVAEASDPLVAALEAQGAHIVGKSAVPELGLTVDTEPTGLPAVDNPLWPGHTPGGSSGGAAVQVARGLLRAAHASDAGGSIRIPAAACGVVGYKPAGEGLSAAGFITRTVEDAAFLHGIVPVAPRARVGVLVEPLFAETEVAPVMLTAVREARRALELAGYETVEIVPYPQAGETFEAFRRIFSSSFVDLDEAEGYVAWVRELGRSWDARQRSEAMAHAMALPELLAREWGVDAVLTPMLTGDPPPQGHFRAREHEENFAEQTRWSPWGSVFNVARLPAISVPWPVPGRQPVGVQLGSVTLSGEELLGLARALHD